MRLLACLLLAAGAAAGEAPAPPADARPAQRTPGELFDLADADGDGRVTREELAAAIAAQLAAERERLFARIDADGDGQISKAEFLAFEPPPPPAPPGRPGPPDQAGPAGPPPRGRKPDPGEMIRRYDANGDGAITRDELPAPP